MRNFFGCYLLESKVSAGVVLLQPQVAVRNSSYMLQRICI